MYYEINVSKLNEKTGRYHHFFATSERSCRAPWEYEKVLIAIKERFKEPEYLITATRWETRGTTISTTPEKEVTK